MHMSYFLCLFLGWLPNVQRAALVNLGDLTAYDQAKTFLVLRGFDADSKVRHQFKSQISYSRFNPLNIHKYFRSLTQCLVLRQH